MLKVLPLLGAWLMAAASIIAGGLAIPAYVSPGPGPEQAHGAALILRSVVLLLAASLVLVFTRPPAGVRLTVLAVSSMSVLGAALAAWRLQAWMIGGMIGLAFVGWLLLLPGASVRRTAGGAEARD